jgi:hypothetical protein
MRLVVPAVLVVALLAAGCGSSGGDKSSSSPTTATTPTATQTATQQPTTGAGTNAPADAYKQQAEEIAKRVKSDSDAASAKFSSATSPDQLVTEFEDYKAKLDKSIGDFDALQPPPAIQSEHEKFVADLKALSGDLGDATEALKNKDTAALQKVQTKVATDSQALTQSAAALDAKLGGL